MMTMSSLESLLNEARSLATRMSKRDKDVDGLLVQAESVHARLEIMQQYQEETLSLSELCQVRRPRAQLVVSVVAENKQLKELERENKDLRTALDEHQTALDLIMSKYREQMLKLLETDGGGAAHTPEEAAAVDEISLQQHPMVLKMADKMLEMATVMRTAASYDDISVTGLESRLSQLEAENQTLRQLLQIASPLTPVATAVPGPHSATAAIDDAQS